VAAAGAGDLDGEVVCAATGAAINKLNHTAAEK
jgi:hypothetical protein